MNILISGASGYIGTKLVRAFIQAGVRPGLITRSSDAILAYFNPADIDVYTADITKPLAFVLKQDYDLFIHLAAANDIDSRDPRDALLTTTLGTRNCLDFCKLNEIHKFIYFSTFQVLGSNTGKLSEQVQPTPSNDYGVTHLFAEEYVRMFQRNHGIDYLILRPTNIFGAPVSIDVDRWSLVPNCFCKELMEQGSITLMSSGKQIRDFINLNDLVDITLLFTSKFNEFTNRTIHLSSGNNYSILEIAEVCMKVYTNRMGKKPALKILSEEPRNPNEYTIDRTILLELDCHFRPHNSIVKEVNAIFDLLIQNKNHGFNSTI